MKTGKQRVQKELILFDSISRKSKGEKVSFWIGNQGDYLFKSSEKLGTMSPVSQVYLNRKYFTGIFRTKNKDIYSGDIKEIDKKRYLLFKVIDKDKINIYEKI